MLQTPRLVLRAFCENDREPFAAINADPRVHYWLGGPIDRATSDASLDEVNAQIARHGFGLWAAEHRADRRLAGMIGLKPTPPDLPVSPAIEVGWHLAVAYWGQGLAAEGARAALDWAFRNLAVREVISTTAASNLRSQGVMRRLGMTPQPSRTFDHPHLPAEHPLRPHLVFAITRQEAAAQRLLGEPADPHQPLSAATG